MLALTQSGSCQFHQSVQINQTGKEELVNKPKATWRYHCTTRTTPGTNNDDKNLVTFKIWKIDKQKKSTIYAVFPTLLVR